MATIADKLVTVFDRVPLCEIGTLYICDANDNCPHNQLNTIRTLEDLESIVPSGNVIVLITYHLGSFNDVLMVSYQDKVEYEKGSSVVKCMNALYKKLKVIAAEILATYPPGTDPADIDTQYLANLRGYDYNTLEYESRSFKTEITLEDFIAGANTRVGLVLDIIVIEELDGTIPNQQYIGKIRYQTMKIGLTGALDRVESFPVTAISFTGKTIATVIHKMEIWYEYHTIDKDILAKHAPVRNYQKFVQTPAITIPEEALVLMEE